MYIEDQVRQDCFNRGYKQGRNDVAKEIWDDIMSYYFALRVMGNATVELDKLAEIWSKRGVEVK